MLAATTMCGCQQGTASQSAAERPRAAEELVRQVSLGHTTASDVEQQFGTADERPGYKAALRRPSPAREVCGTFATPIVASRRLELPAEPPHVPRHLRCL